jgi:molybdopterin-guanine dinucleotide biosynthesis protein A
MAPQSTKEITGLVLAGGRGSRMGGVDKGWVHYRGRPLIETVAERFALQVGPLIVSANRNLARYRSVSAVTAVVADADADFAGPLAGILAALAIVRTPWLAIVPCDAPHLPTDLVQRLAAVLDARQAACARVELALQPVFALIACSLQPAMRSYFDAGGRSLRGWLESADALAVDFDDASAFSNVNTYDAAGDHAA